MVDCYVSSKILPVVEYPNPTLQVSSVLADLEKLDELQDFIDDMIYTMFYHQGVGLAAPQVGRNIRLFIIDQRPINGNLRVEPWVFINPTLEPLSDNCVLRTEGCLSFPGLFTKVLRPEWVKVTAYNRKGEEFSMDASHHPLFSIALQHEFDHLEGTLLSDCVKGRDHRKFKRWAAKRP